MHKLRVFATRKPQGRYIMRKIFWVSFLFFVFLFLRCSRFQLKSSACLKVTFLFSPLLNQTPNSKANLS